MVVTNEYISAVCAKAIKAMEGHGATIETMKFIIARQKEHMGVLRDTIALHEKTIRELGGGEYDPN